MSSPKSLASFIGFVLLTLSSAFTDSYGEGRDFGPFGVPMARFDELMDAPNATSKYPIAAPDTSAPYPAPGPADGWSWTVSVVADIAMTESNSTTADWYPNQTFTGSQAVLQAPTGSGSTVDESWLVCVLEWRMDPENFPAKLRKDDGSCSSTLSEQCIRGVEARTVQEYKSPHYLNLPCSCPDFDKLTGCNGEEVSFPKSGGGCVANTFNATAINKWPEGKFNVVRYGGTPHSHGNQTAYSQTGSLTWPVLIMWGPSDATRNTTGQVEIPDTAAKMSCLRAKEATEGSIVPGIGGTSGGNREASLSSIVFVAAIVLVGGWVVI